MLNHQYEEGHERLGASNSHLARSRVGNEFNVTNALAELVESGAGPREQRLTVGRREYARWRSVKEADPKRTLQVSDYI